jgi:hypothetical protein
MALKLRFVGEALVLSKNFLDSVQAPQRRQSFALERSFDLRHPAFHGSMNTRHHFRCYRLDELRIYRRSSHAGIRTFPMPG